VKNPRLGENVDFSALRVLVIVVGACLIVIWIIAVFAWFHRSQGTLPDYRNPKYVTVISDADDQKKLDQLRNEGVDLSKPTRITHYVYLPTAGEADVAGAELKSDGYEVRTTNAPPARTDQKWLLAATHSAVPTMDYFRESRNSFTNLAIEHNGDYIGWSISGASSSGHTN
jgi:cytochrome bd-type quinol oxidase subunit 1